MKFSKYIIILTFSIFFTNNLNAQDTSKPIFFFGPYADFNYNYHFTNFGSLPPFPNCCPEFKSGSGTGFSVGGYFQTEIVRDILFAVRLGISDIGANLTTNEYIGGTYVSTATQPVTVIDTSVNVEYSVNSKLLMFDIEPMIGMKLFNNFSLNLGLKAGYLFTSRFAQKEEITSPDNVTFLSGSRVRNTYVNEIIPNSNSIQIFGTISATYDLKVGQDLYLTPEIRYNVPFLDISKSETKDTDYWKASTFQFGAIFKIPVYPPPPAMPVDTNYKERVERDTALIVEKNAVSRVELSNTETETLVEQIDDNQVEITTIFKEHYKRYEPKIIGLKCSVYCYSYDLPGRITKNPQITIEEVETEEGFPLLTHVFFKVGSSELNSSGLNLLNKNQTGDFDENSLEWITMNIYHDLLNIIGSRLKKNPGSTITITGCNNNLTPNELNNQKLSIDRANSVRDYLIGVWGIDPPRIKIRRLNLPPNPGNINIQEGIEENQRAEISSDNFEIVKPVFLKKIDRQANPPSVTIVPYSKADAGVEKISIQVMQGANELREFNEEIVPDSVIWLVETEPMPSTNEDINIGLTVWDNEGQKCESKDKLNITQKTIQIKRQEQSGDKIIQKYSLILFNYDKSELTPGHISILEKIRKEIKPDSKVEITGYADRTGLSDYNRELAQKRAEESKKQLFVEGADYTIIPIGSDELIYNNDTPQGRSYCRTVKIKIETPVK